MKLFGVQVQTNAFAFIPIEEGFSGGKRFHQKIIHGVDSKEFTNQYLFFCWNEIFCLQTSCFHKLS